MIDISRKSSVLWFGSKSCPLRYSGALVHFGEILQEL
jgi:hypothetical protein